MGGVDVVKLTVGPTDGDSLFGDLDDRLEEAQLFRKTLAGGDLRLQFGGAGLDPFLQSGVEGLDLLLGRLLRGDIDVNAAHPDGLTVRTAIDPAHGADPMAGAIRPDDGKVHPVIFPAIGGPTPGLLHPRPVLGRQQRQETRVGHGLPDRQTELAETLIVPVELPRGVMAIPETQLGPFHGQAQAFFIGTGRHGGLITHRHARVSP